MRSSFSHDLNAASPIYATYFGRLISVNDLHPSKVPASIRVTASGRDTVSRPQQCKNAHSSMVVTLLGITTDFKLPQAQNARFPIVPRLLGRSMRSSFSHDLNAASPMWSNELFMTNSTRFSHSAKAPLPIFFIVEGSTTLARFSQYANAKSPISITPSGIMISTSSLFWQFSLGAIQLDELTMSSVKLKLFIAYFLSEHCYKCHLGCPTSPVVVFATVLNTF